MGIDRNYETRACYIQIKYRKEYVCILRVSINGLSDGEEHRTALSTRAYQCNIGTAVVNLQSHAEVTNVKFQL